MMTDNANKQDNTLNEAKEYLDLALEFADSDTEADRWGAMFDVQMAQATTAIAIAQQLIRIADALESANGHLHMVSQAAEVVGRNAV